MSFHKSSLQILANYCIAVTESMAYTLMRTAHSAFIKETQDFSCLLLTPQGQTFASPKTLGATWYPGLDCGAVLPLTEPCQPGDICMTNDTYSGYVATHTPDITMWKPVFVDGEIVCYVAGHVHNTDMGGAVPASLSRTLTEIHQEGIRFPPCKIVRAGVLDEALEAATAIASLSLPAVMMAKECVNRAWESSLAEGTLFERRAFHSLFASHDQKEGMAAFIEKRQAEFRHE